MTKPYKIKRNNNNKTYTYWAVDFTEDISGSNKKSRRKTFKTKSEADTFAKDLNDAEIRCSLTRKVEGVSLVDRLPELAQAYEIIGEDVSLLEVINFYAENNPGVLSKVTVNEAVEEYLLYMKSCRNGRGMSVKHIADVTSKLNKLLEYCDKLKNINIESALLLKKLTKIKIIEYLDHHQNNLTLRDGKDHSVDRNNHLCAIKSFLEWCSKKKEWIKFNPAAKIQKVDEPIKEIEYYTKEDVKLILNKLQEAYPELIPAFVLMTFAGIRPMEVKRLATYKGLIDFENRRIELTTKIVKPKKSGKARSRSLEGLPENIWKWLSLFRSKDGELKLNVDNIDMKLRRVRCELGVKMIHDGLRHAFATYAVPYYENKTKVSMWMGHRDFTMLDEHYMGVEIKSNAKKFFEIYPSEKIQHMKNNKIKFIDWPSDNELRIMVNTMPMTAVAIELGCSNNAVKKRCKKQGILVNRTKCVAA